MRFAQAEFEALNIVDLEPARKLIAREFSALASCPDTLAELAGQGFIVARIVWTPARHSSRAHNRPHRDAGTKRSVVSVPFGPSNPRGR